MSAAIPVLGACLLAYTYKAPEQLICTLVALLQVLADIANMYHHGGYLCCLSSGAIWLPNLHFTELLVINRAYIYVQVFQEPNKRQARMQQAFKAYLEERGVNAELGRLLMNLSWDKERTLLPPKRRKYVKWLLGMQEFLEE